MLCGETWRARRSHILPVLLTPGPPMPHRVYPRPRPRTPLAVMMFLCCAGAALARLDVALRIEPRRLRAVHDSPEEWRRERGAIEQEVAQDLSEPGYVLFEKLRARMFAGTPYEHTPLGTRPSFEKTTARMLKSFHDTWYAPNNALLVIAGDVDPPTALAEVKRLFGSLAPKKLPAKPRVRLRPVHPPSFALDTDRPSGPLMIALRTPGPRDADLAALEPLSR